MIDLPPHKVACTSCGRTYVLDPQLIPATGARVACRRCGVKFTVYPPGSGRTVAETPLSVEAMQPPPRHAHAPDAHEPRRVWVFPDDPALQREGVMISLRTELAPFRARFVDAETRAVLSLRTISSAEWPNIVVFGDLHVLLEDQLLQTVATRAGVHRVLVSTHHNPELIRTAQEYCGFDRHLTLPLTPLDLRLALGLNRAS